MKLKENIYEAIENMNSAELRVLYEQIRLMQKSHEDSDKRESRISIERIHEMTSSSKSSWSESVIEGRQDRI